MDRGEVVGERSADIAVDDDLAAILAGSAAATDADAGAAGAIHGHIAGDREAARAAAAADRLREDAVGLISRSIDGSGVVDRHQLRRTTATALAADRNRGAGLLAGATDGHRRAAIAAAAAHRLRKDAVGAVLEGDDVADRGHRHRTGITTTFAAAADADADRAAFRGDGQRAREAAIAAAAAHRLRQDAVGLDALGPDIAIADDGDRLAVAAIVAAAADTNAQAGLAGQAGGNREATIAATATDRLREDAVRPVAGGLDVAIAVDGNGVGIAAARTGTADADAAGHVLAGGKRDGKAAIAAAATDRLRQDAERILPSGQNVVVAGDVDRTGRRAGTRATADADAQPTAVDPDAEAAGEAAGSATAADRLREDAGRIVALGPDRRCARRRSLQHRLAVSADDAIALDGHIASR